MAAGPGDRPGSGGHRVGDGPGAVAAGPGGVWVSDEFDGTVARIDPGTNRVVGRTLVDASPVVSPWRARACGLRPGGSPQDGHRGGTLTVASSQPAGITSIDPAVAYGPDPETWHVLTMVYDGLVGLRRTDGAAGLTLVPDLATELPQPTTEAAPTPSRCGVASGLHRRSGAARDIRRVLERVHQWRRLPRLLRRHFGARACLPVPRPPAQCDLSRRIVTDGAAYTVTIRLTAPATDSSTSCSQLRQGGPPGAPAPDIGSASLSGPGPYMISRYHEGKPMTLVRDPYFRHGPSPRSHRLCRTQSL